MNNKKEKIKLKRPESTPWGKFMLDTISSDIGARKPNGWHWFWCLYYAKHRFENFDLETIQNTLPDGHWIKKINGSDIANNEHDYKDDIYPMVATLFEEIGKPEIISTINFSEILFENDIENDIEDDIDFSNFIFPIDTSFEHAQFPQDINFINAVFLKDAVFNDAKFFANAYFNDAVFCETADFEDATFQTKDSYCKETAKFRNTVFEKIANFRNATFWGYANFKGAKLAGRAFFQKAKFKWHAPRFYDATFNNEMTWSGIKLPKFAEAKVDRYKKVGEEFELDECDECTDCPKCAERAECIKRAECVRCKALIEENRTRRIEENQNSYENTAILLAGTKKYHDQHFFFREEMRCRRELEGDTLIRWAFGLYEGLTDYGYGIERAFKAWAWHIVFGIIAIATTASCAGVGLQENLFCSISTSIANANPFVFVIIKDGSLMECYKELNMRSPMMFGAIRGFQTFIGVTLLFLLLTTLRVRFRLKTTNN